MSDREVIPIREQAEAQSDHDPVSPPHYKGQGDVDIECIDAIEAALTPEEFRGYLKGTAFKYIWRLGKKGPSLVDARKHHWFSHKLVSTLARRKDA
jgi:hypothetical protein